MKKNLHLIFGVSAILTGVAGLFVLSFTDFGDKTFIYCFAGTGGFAALMVLFDPINQPISTGKAMYVTLLIAACIMVLFSSCSHKGYGCTGRSKHITGYKSPLGKGY